MYYQYLMLSSLQELENRLMLAEQHRKSLVWQKNYLLMLLTSSQQQKKAIKGKGQAKVPAITAFFSAYPKLKNRTPTIKFR